MLTGMLSGGLVIHGIGYLELPPTGPGQTAPFTQYMCTNTTDSSMYPCGTKAWCGNLIATGLKVTS